MIPGFKPMLFPNEATKAEDIHGEYLMSPKMDGVRCIIADGHIMSRSASEAGDPIPLKRIQSQSIVRRLHPLADLADENNILLDGELYAHGMDFNTLSGHVRRIEGEAPADILFHAFDALSMNKEMRNAGAFERDAMLNSFVSMAWEIYGLKTIYRVNQYTVREPAQITSLFEGFLEKGFEGAILKRGGSIYKFGRLTTKSGDGYKFKPYMTFDAKIIGVEEATVVDEFAEKKTDSFGRSHTSKKMDDRIPCGKAASFIVMFEGFECRPMLPMTDAEKKYIFENQDKYIGRWIEFSGMRVGAKDRVRHPKWIRYRDDKE